MEKPSQSLHKGFTLIELLVVIAIISLLSSIVLGNLTTARKLTKDALRRTDFKSLQNALEEYYLDNGSYPSTVSAGHVYWIDSLHHPTDWIPGLVPKYISRLPIEPDQSTLCLADQPPTTNDPYGTSYRYRSDGISYKIHDHCAPISKQMTNTSDSMYHCSGVIPIGAGHPSSWSVCNGPIPCNVLWCTNDGTGSETGNADNIPQKP